METRAAVLSQTDRNTARCNSAPDIHGQIAGGSDTRVFNSKTRGTGSIQGCANCNTYRDVWESAAEILADAVDANSTDDLLELARESAELIASLTIQLRYAQRQLALAKVR